MGTGLGPRTRDVERFVERLYKLSDGEVLRLGAFGDRSMSPAASPIYRAVRERVRTAHREQAVEQGRELLLAWAMRPSDLPLPGFATLPIGDLEANAVDSRREAFPGAYDTMVGYIARDLLTAEEFDFLTAPWQEVAGDRDLGA
jgi:hypothetical protein